MKLNIKNQIKKLSPRISMSSVINEAVVNSIQAGATKITLKIFRDTKQTELLDDKPKIVGLDIIDNGEGFTDKNISSFCEYGSEHKIDQGCKGIGRLCYLKVFDDIKIKSFVFSTKQVVSLKFTDHFNEKDFSIEQAANIPSSETTISLRKIKNNYSKSLEIKDIEKNLYYHILPILYFNSEKEIQIEIVDTFDVPISQYIKTSDLPQFEVLPFQVGECETNDKKEIDFTLHYSIKPATEENLIEFYCADKRTVCKFKDKELKILSIKKSEVIFLVTSDYFDLAVNDERDDFDIFPIKTDLTRKISWEKINNKLKDILKTIIYKEHPDLEQENKKIIKSIREDNLHLIDYMVDIDSLGGLIDSETIIEKAEQLYQQDKKDFRAKLKSNSTASSEIIEQASALAGKELIEYVITRNKIITQFEALDLKQEKNEEIVRNHILQRGLFGDSFNPIPVEKNNLWLLDDKFMTYNYVASEKTINTLLKSVGLKETESSDRFDVGIYSNSKEAKRVILIEFKKLSANYKENGAGIDQLFKYALELQKAGINEIYLYLIAEIEDTFRSMLTGSVRGFSRVFSQDGELYQRSYDDVNAYIQVISPKALISDAKARNQTFINMIKVLSEASQS